MLADVCTERVQALLYCLNIAEFKRLILPVNADIRIYYSVP